MSYVLLEKKKPFVKKAILRIHLYLGQLCDSFPGEDPRIRVVREPRASDFPRFPVCAVKIVTHTNDPTL